MCKQTFAWPEHLKTHIRTKHRAELMARAGNYKNEIKEEEEEAKKKPDKTVARMQARLPGGISVQSVPVNEAAKRRVLDFQVTQLSRPSLISKSKETQLSRPSVISKARVTQSRWANTISTAKVTVPKEMVKSSEPSRASFPNIPQSSLAAKRISVANVQQSNFNGKHDSINLADFTGQIATEKYLTTDLAKEHCNGQDLTTELSKENPTWKRKGDPATAVDQHKKHKSGKGVLVRTQIQIQDVWKPSMSNTNTMISFMKCYQNICINFKKFLILF